MARIICLWLRIVVFAKVRKTTFVLKHTLLISWNRITQEEDKQLITAHKLMFLFSDEARTRVIHAMYIEDFTGC